MNGERYLKTMDKRTQEQIREMQARWPGRQYSVSDWRKKYSPETIQRGQMLLDQGQVRLLGRRWEYSNILAFPGIKGRPDVRMSRIPSEIGDTWDRAYIECTCHRPYCEHRAAALLMYERDNGPVVLWESEYVYRRRIEKEKNDADREARLREDSKIGTEPVPALQAFPGMVLQEPVIYDLEKALAEWQTTPAAIARMKEAHKDQSQYTGGISETQHRDGSRELTFSHSYQNPLYYGRTMGTLYPTGLQIKCLREEREYPSMSYYVSADTLLYMAPEKHLLNEWELEDIRQLWNYLNEKVSSQVTDETAEVFFQGIRAQREEKAVKAAPVVNDVLQKAEVIDLQPRIQVDYGEPALSFRIGTAGGRMYVLKSCQSLIMAADKEGKLQLGKAESLDFSRQAFRPEAAALYDYIKRHKRDSYGGMYQVPLKGSALDNFYDMAEGIRCEYQDKTNSIKSDRVSVGHSDIHFTLTADRLMDARGHFMGIVVSGMIPVMIKGNSYQYCLTSNALSRISKEEKKVLAPFIKVADESGYFRFQVGTERLQEFYYRVLPGLTDNPCVEFVDHCEEEVMAILPPEPQFTFFLDLDDQLLSLRCTVRYGEAEYPLVDSANMDRTGRDTEEEAAVQQIIGQWLTYQGKNTFVRTVTDDELYDFLTSGIPALEYHGQVRGTSAFKARKVTSPPRVRLGISVNGAGLLDISVTSQDLSAKELMAIYESYTKRKRFYRLKSGDFVDLTRTEDFHEMDTFLSQLDISPRDVIQKKIQVPLYRALYLDRMLESHEQLATTRDRTYRALIRNFKTVRESEYEPPASMDSVLRPYQTYGYKWLATMQAAGFGGILADEMGLGKTIQMISLMLANKEQGTQKDPALVVCPASLVYNWQEEFQRFAPALKVSPVTGTAGARGRVLADRSGTDVLVTSYDLLKRDIAIYEGMHFSCCVLDEAQYIKNSRSAAAKSVKLIHADHRFALTGTPIENRLLELWSVFDFLMPGFLYSQADFEKNYELPITKQKDEKITEKLKTMTAPFILRRKKAEVLSDLPEKLEEVRYARLGGKQQKLYDAQVLRMKKMLAGGELAGEEKIKMFAELTRIRQICCDPSLLMEDYDGESAKREACLELIQSAMEGGHRMLVFSQFVTMLDLLEQDLKKLGIPYYKLIGATTKEKRASMVRAFNEGDTPVFLISLKAGGTGLNLTGADVVIHYDPWWNLAAQNQATDRAHRIGQTREVTVFKLILKDTIEERIVALQDAKKDLADAILEGQRESILALSSEELLALLN